MGLIRLACRSVKTDLSKSIFYFLAFVLTTIFIFLFFNLTLNPNTGIDMGKDDSTFITPIAVFVILIAMICVFMANNYYVKAKSKDVSIVLMSGASVYQVGVYLLIQSFIIMSLAIVVGFAISFLLVPYVNSLFFQAFDYQGDLGFIANQTYIATAIILAFEIAWCTLLNMGYCYKTSINNMMVASVKIENYGMKFKSISNKLYLVMFFVPVIAFIFSDDPMGYFFFSVIGVVGIYGVIKKILPSYLKERLSDKDLEDRYNLITLGYVKYDLQEVLTLVVTIMMSSILLMCIVLTTLDQPFVSMVALISYISIMVLLSLTIIFKIGMNLQNRKKTFINLGHLGYLKKELKLIMNRELLIFYGIILVVPLFYQLIIMIKLIVINTINLTLGGIIIIIPILTMFVSFLITMKIYRSILK